MMMTSEWTATRIAKQQSHELMRAAAQRRLARAASHDAAGYGAAGYAAAERTNLPHQHADLASRVRALGLSLPSARRADTAA